MDFKALCVLLRPPQKTITQTVRIMRLTAILLLIACLHVSARGWSQTVTISEKNVPVQKIFKEIFRQTGVSIIYNDTLFEHFAPVTVEVKDAQIRQVLDLCLKNQLFDYEMENNMIVVTRVFKEARFRDTTIRRDIVPEVTGTVMDETGEPLAGATIKLKNGKIVGLSDEKGDFKLKNVSTNAVLEVSFTGYGITEIQVNSKSALKISLKRANNKLDDVQVIAYGTTTERLNTGDVTTVTSKEIEEQPVSNPLAALEGRVPGLVVTQTTGAPGGGFTVQIRGQNSITNGNYPFYVIDGVPYPSQTQPLINTILQGGSPLNFINPADIESIEVLKDADATSIYGSQAANGAILITTKKGKAGRTTVNLNAYSGDGAVTRNPQLLNTQQYLAMRNEAFANDGATPSPTSDYDLTFWDTTRYTNWEKVFLGNTAHYDDAQASVSGGTTNTQYMVGAGYHRETSVFPVILPGQGADQKGSVHFNMVTTSDNKRFKLTLTGSYVSDVNTVQPNDFTYVAYSLPPDAPAILNKDGTLNWDPLSPGQVGTWTNPFGALYETYKGTTSNLVSNAIISYTLAHGLDIKTSFGYTITQTNELINTPTTSVDPGYLLTAQEYSSSQFETQNTHSWIVEPQVNYRLNLGKDGILTALLGSTFQENITNFQILDATGFISDAFLGDINAASTVTPQGSTNTDYKYNAAFGRINYNWKDKYIVNLTGRRDGSSRFGPGKQFADFGAVGAAWIFTNEQFFKDHLQGLSFGKLRCSYGTSGNDQIGDYQFLDLYSARSVGNPYQGIQSLEPRALFNPDLAWELDKKVEGGLELGFLKDRITTTVSVFRNRSGNQLITEPLSAVTGFSGITDNLSALVQNTGVELVFRSINIRSKNFTWSSSLNATVPRNKLIAFPNLANSSYTNSLVIGQPLSIKQVYHFTAVNDTTGLYQYATYKGVPTYNPNYLTDQTTLVNTLPRFYGGLQNTLQFKQFTLDFLFQFVKQTGTNFLYFLSEESIMPGTMVNQPKAILDRWQKPGDQKPYEMYSQNFSGNAYNAFNYIYQSHDAYSDASFIRLKNLSLSYALPVSIVQRWHLQTFRVYVQGQNLLTITKYKGNDPESLELLYPTAHPGIDSRVTSILIMLIEICTLKYLNNSYVFF